MPQLLALKGSGLVFVATPDGTIRRSSRAGDGLYAWDTRHLSEYRVRLAAPADLQPRRGELLPDGARLEYTAWRAGRALLLRIRRRLRLDRELSDRWSV
ncbi:MAG: glycogen debranching N-terminal domain-containing protein, partial [Candidatus Limnocylindria bacterium]